MPNDRLFGPFTSSIRVFSCNDPATSELLGHADPDGLTRLDATLTDINITGSDPTLQVRARDGMNWTIELASHARNRALGLTDAPMLPGDRVRVTGLCAHHFGETRLKALRLTIGEQCFDMAADTETAA